ncbi:hypothetical protein R0381_003275 [Jeongeupia wiesaeckerbachi]|uniref:hypothetical protein n=1 Tax=Jeongeupia wiesaeckerbachi TaxID=3051218 RepID=UPI003D8094BF
MTPKTNSESIWGPTLMLAGVCVAAAAQIMGYAAPFFYIFAVKIAYPIALAFMVDAWEKKGIATKESGDMALTVHIHGIPAQIHENTKFLKNVNFKLQTDLESKLTLASQLKVLLTGSVFVLSIYNFVVINNTFTFGAWDFFRISFGICICTFFWKKLRESMNLLLTCTRKEWHIGTTSTVLGTAFSAFFVENKDGDNQYHSFLEKLIA